MAMWVAAVWAAGRIAQRWNWVAFLPVLNH